MSEEIEIGLRQKLRESFISGEPDAFTDEALLELLLGYALSRGLYCFCQESDQGKGYVFWLR